IDHRRNGRRSGEDPKRWTLAQWADDVKGLCETLGIEKPIVYGVSFGGFVAQAYATRYPEHPAKLVLVSTAARIDYNEIFAAFEWVGGMEARVIAESYWRDPTPRAGRSTSRYASRSIALGLLVTSTRSRGQS